jgi:hypothetical protein
MSAVSAPGSRLIVPVPNLGVSQVWDVGLVRFHPAGSASDLVAAASGGTLASAQPWLREMMTGQVTELGRGVVAEVTAGDLDEAMPLIASALAALRVVQHIQSPMCDSRHQTFGLPGQVMSARVDYFSLTGGLSMGGKWVGALAGWTFTDDDHEAWVRDPAYRFVDEALARPEADRTVLQRRALVTIDLLSEAWLSWQPDVALLNSAMALEVLLGEEGDKQKKFRLARRVSYFVCGWPGDDRYTAGRRPACPLLTLPLGAGGQPRKELKELIADVYAGRVGPCTQFFDVLDLYDARNRIVHGGRLGLTERQQSQATWFIASWLLRQVLEWFAGHPDAELSALDAEIASVPARTV